MDATPKAKREFDPDFSPLHVSNQDAAKDHGLTWDRRRQAYVDQDGCPRRDRFGQVLG